MPLIIFGFLAWFAIAFLWAIGFGRFLKNNETSELTAWQKHHQDNPTKENE